MAMEEKRFLDYEGLSLYDYLLRKDVAKDIKEVDDKITEYIEGTEEEKPLYYEMEWDEVLGDYVNVYDYDEAEGTAVDGEIYYERSGEGTTLDPFVYTECDPQPAIGDSVEGLYTQGDPKTTTEPTEAEKDYPVIDPVTGEQETQTVVIVNDATKDTIMSTIADNTITDEEIRDLFEE